MHSEKQLIKACKHRDPFSVLGMHEKKGEIIVRIYLPYAKCVSVIDIKTNKKYKTILNDGIFEAKVGKRFFKYKLLIESELGSETKYDPYSFMPVINKEQLELFNNGKNYNIYEILGSHIVTAENIKGTLFAVWAPFAKRISVVGDFNFWDNRIHQMRIRGNSGVWELFIPDIKDKAIYKYEILTSEDKIVLKTDPYAFYSEYRPKNSSVVYDIENYKWNDDSFIKSREENNYLEQAISIYEVHLGSWQKDENNNFLNYREIGERLAKYVKEMGYTHVELMPVTEHPLDDSWGYQVIGYYSITSRYGTPTDFQYLIDHLHQNKIGVILDWVPAHFPKDEHGLVKFDGTCLYEHTNPKQGEHPDWGTLIYNLGRNEVKNFLIANALFLFDKYHIDGLRVDAVASMLYLDYGKKHGEWIANEYGGNENLDSIKFFRELNETVYKKYKGVMMIAEESTAWPMVSAPPYLGGLGFGLKWNMGWMNDFLRYMSMDSIYRKYHHNLITFSFMYAFSENFVLPISHDEVVHGKYSMLNKMPGTTEEKFAGLRVGYGYQFMHPGKKLMFMGCEFGQSIEWRFFESLVWPKLEENSLSIKLQKYIKDLNNLYKTHKALYEVDFSHEGFEWLNCNDFEHSIIVFLRKPKNWRDMLLIVCNFTPIAHEHYRFGVPFKTYYEEIFNSDSKLYGGNDYGNAGGLESDNIECENQKFSLAIKIPALSLLVFKPHIPAAGEITVPSKDLEADTEKEAGLEI